MVTVWLTIIMAFLLGMYYWLKTSTWNIKMMYTDNQILQKLKETTDADLIKILQECGTDKFEIKDVDKLSGKERRDYFKSIENLFDNIKSHFESECAQMLIDRRHNDIDYVMEVERHCQNQESCKKCELKTMKIQLKY